MNLKLIRYKKNKTNYLFNKTRFFFLFHITSNNFANQVIVDQNCKKNGLRYYKLKNSLAKIQTKISIFKNLINLFIGPMFLISTQKNFSLQKIYNQQQDIMAIRLNNSIYSISQLKNLSTTNYMLTFQKFISFLKLYLVFSTKLLANIKKK